MPETLRPHIRVQIKYHVSEAGDRLILPQLDPTNQHLKYTIEYKESKLPVAATFAARCEHDKLVQRLHRAYLDMRAKQLQYDSIWQFFRLYMAEPTDQLPDALRKRKWTWQDVVPRIQSRVCCARGIHRTYISEHDQHGQNDEEGSSARHEVSSSGSSGSYTLVILDVREDISYPMQVLEGDEDDEQEGQEGVQGEECEEGSE